MANNLGKRLLKCGAEILCAGLKHVPFIGAPIELIHDCIQVADKIKMEQQLHDLAGRVKQLEEARACTPEEVRAIVQEAIEEYMAKGQAVSEDKKEAIHDIMQSMPGNVGQQISATISHAGKKSTSLFVALPIGNEAGLEQEQRRFYLSLIPSRRPQYKSKMQVPNKPCWEFEDLLGMGGFGEVWKIKHKLLRQAQAIKLCLNKESGLILRQEAKTIAVLQEELSQHPNIVAVLDANVEDWPYWIAFEYISGGTLESYIRSFGGPLPLEEVSRLFTGICEGIKSAHEHNIVHRDIKPANILLTPTCQPKVADFGLGKIIIEETNKRESVQASMQLHSMRGAGTFIYMSREQRNGLPADPSDDVFGLAVVLYQMLMGMPNQDPQYLRSDLKKLKTKPPAEISDILEDSLALPRGERIENASVMLDRFCSACEKNNLPYISADQTGAVGFAGSGAAGAGISGGVGSSAGIGISGGAGRVTSQIMIASQKELDDLQKKISSAKQALADLESQILVKQKEYGVAWERLEKVETICKQKEKAVKQMQDALETAKQILEETQETQAKVEKEISQAKQERQENETALTQTKQELSQIQTAISQAKQELIQTQTATSQAKQELIQTQTAISQAKTASQTASRIQAETSNIIVGDIEEPEGFKYLRSTKYTCGRLSNTIKEYKHTQTGLEFVLIPGGTFQMGSNMEDDEKPIHKVTLSPYFISKTTVTQAVWQNVMGTNPSNFKGDNHPVETVSWDDCLEFCQKIGLALPTEAQWEYAARGGSSGKWCCGDNESELKKYAWYGEPYPGKGHHEVGKKLPNAYGIYDMHGNVWEWCWDVYGPYPSESQNNPTGIQSGSGRVNRGGSWYSTADYLRSAFRNGYVPDYGGSNLGFRVVPAMP